MNDQMEFETARKASRKHISKIAHFVVITIFNNDDASRFDNFQFELVIVDEDLEDENKWHLLQQAMLSTQPKVSTEVIYYKLALDSKIYSIGYTIRFLPPIARFGTFDGNLPFLRINCPPQRPERPDWNQKLIVGLAKDSNIWSRKGKMIIENRLLAESPVYFTPG